MRDLDIPHPDAMRTVEMGKWTISLYETPHVDRMGKSGIRVTIHEDEALVYDTGAAPYGLVYVPGHQSIDGNASLFSAISLCCHDASHDREGNSRDSGFDDEGLSDLAECHEEDDATQA